LPRPVVRGVDALYEDGFFYVTTNSMSNKMKQIEKNRCILAIRLTRGTLNINHWEKLYHMDFVNKKPME
jgi:hypothetical protein